MKTAVTLTLDLDVMTELRKKHNVNISSLVNDFLRSYLNAPEMQKAETFTETELDILKLQTQIAELEEHKKKLAKDSVIIRE